MSNEPTIVKQWDSLPPEVYANGEWFSTRLLYKQYHDQKAEIDRLQAENTALVHDNERLIKTSSELATENERLREGLGELKQENE